LVGDEADDGRIRVDAQDCLGVRMCFRPAPLGPRKPVTLPGAAVKVTLSKAVNRP
jgi:hypothetical protein